MKIAFTFNIRHGKQALDSQSQAEAEFDEPKTIKALHNAIVANGYDCVDVEANLDAFEKLRALVGKVDLVFNIAEGKRGEIREAQIPAILEMLGLPYTHSGALTQAINLDKSLTKKIWQFHGLPTPKFVELGPDEEPYVEARLPSPEGEASGGQGLRYPVLVKPNSEGSSKGIFNDNLVTEPPKLLDKIKETRKKYGDGVLVEEFLPGREFTVTVMGNPGIGKGVYLLPIVEQNYAVFPKNLQKFASYEAKWFFEDTLPNPHLAYICPAKIEPELENLIKTICLKAFTVLGCRDVARIDLRLNAQGQPGLLELNTMPGMIPGTDVVSYFPVAARAMGWNYNEMVGAIINHARERLRI